MYRDGALATLRSIIGDVAADPGGDWLNGGDEPTMERVRDVLSQLADSVRIETHEALWEYWPAANLYRCVRGWTNNGQCDRILAGSAAIHGLPVEQHVRAVLP